MKDTQPDQNVLRDLVDLYEGGHFARVESRAKRLIRKFPSSLVLRDILGAALVGQNKLEEAVRACRAAIRIKPDYAVAHSNLGFALQGLGRLEEAVASCRAAIAIKPDHAEAHNNLGNALQGLGRFEEAEASYRRALEIAPDYVVALVNLGVALRAQGSLEGAVASYRQAIKIAPGYGAAHANLGEVLRERGNTDEAVASCREAVRLEPASARTHNNLGVALREQGRLEEAVASYREAVAIEPDYVEAHVNLANALADLGRTDAAVASYRRALEIRPDHGPARHMVAALTGETTKTAPDDYVVKLFDDYARKFDRHLVEALGYDAPTRLAGLLCKTMPERKKFDRAVDLGCGTGLSGIAFRDAAVHLTGIDLSNEMLNLAREKNVYDELMQGRIVDVLAGIDRSFDLFICTDVLIYVGDAEEIFRASAARAAPGAVFCVSTEDFDGTGYALRPTGRYAHGDGYVRETAARYGFSALASEDTVIRGRKTAPIAGRLYLFRKSA